MPCSRLCLISWWSSLCLRVFRVVGSLHCSSLTIGRFLGHLHCTSSCLQVVFCAWKCLLLVGLRPLPDVSICALWLPAHLLWPSLRPRVCESSRLSGWLFPFSGPSPMSRLFLSLRPCRSRSPFPSLAPSRWSPCTLRRWAYLTLSGFVLSVPSTSSLRRSRLSFPFAVSPLSHRVFADGHRHLHAVALQEGRLPLHGVPSEPMWLALAPPISPYTGPGQSP